MIDKEKHITSIVRDALGIEAIGCLNCKHFPGKQKGSSCDLMTKEDVVRWQASGRHRCLGETGWCLGEIEGAGGEFRYELWEPKPHPPT